MVCVKKFWGGSGVRAGEGGNRLKVGTREKTIEEKEEIPQSPRKLVMARFLQETLLKGGFWRGG